jgi:hypothetical protein
MSGPQPGTPLPWGACSTGKNMRENYSQPRGVRAEDNGSSATLVAGCFGDTAGGEPAAEANAAYIVHAANNFPKAQALADALWNTVSLARIKWGNLDPDANKVLESALSALADWEGK